MRIKKLPAKVVKEIERVMLSMQFNDMENILYKNHSVVHIKSDKYAATHSNFLSKKVAVRLCSLLNGACKDKTDSFKVINELAIVGIINLGVKEFYIFNKTFDNNPHVDSERIACSTLMDFPDMYRFNFNDIDKKELAILIQKYEERGGLTYLNRFHYEKKFLNPIIEKENKLLRREVVDFVISRGFRELKRDVWGNDKFVLKLDRNFNFYPYITSKAIYMDKIMRDKVSSIFGSYLSVCNQLNNNTFLVSCINDKLRNSIIRNFCGISFIVEFKNKENTNK